MQTLTCGRYEDLPVKWEFGKFSKEWVRRCGLCGVREGG